MIRSYGNDLMVAFKVIRVSKVLKVFLSTLYPNYRGLIIMQTFSLPLNADKKAMIKNRVHRSNMKGKEKRKF